MLIPLVASGPLSPSPLHGNEVRIDASVGRDLGIDRDVVEVVAGNGAVPVVARVRPTQDPAVDESLVEIGRLLWTELQIRPGDPVELRRPVDLPPCETLVLRADEADVELDEFFSELLGQNRPLVQGMRLALPADAGPGRSTVVEVAQPTPSLPVATTSVSGFVSGTASGDRPPTLSEVGGMGEVLDRLRTLVDWPLRRPEIFALLGIQPTKGVLLHGPPGAGKTYLSRALAEELGIHAMSIASTELIGEYPGETEKNIRALFARASQEAPTLVVIDEIDIIAGTRDSLVSQSDVRCATEFLEVLDGLRPHAGVVVLGTTNRLGSIDPAFRRPGRFDDELYVGPPDVAGRSQILSIHARDMPFAPDARVAFERLAGVTHGYVAADLMSVVRETGLAAVRRLYRSRSACFDASAVGDSFRVEAADIQEGLAATSPSILRSVDRPRGAVPWKDLVGLAEVKQQLLSWGLKVTAADEATPGRTGVLVEGPSGNGKSVLALGLAERLGINCVVIEPGEVYSEWLGESERTVRSRFTRALATRPSLVILEHLDILVPSRSSRHRDRASDRVVATVVTCIDDALAKGGMLVIGVTDRPEEVDESVTRAGRLGTRISLRNPDEARRRALLEALSPDPVPIPDDRVRTFLDSTEGMSAAGVVMAIKGAGG